LGGTGSNTTLGFRFKGRLVPTIINGANNNRPVRIAIKKINNHFVAYPWDKRAAPLITRPGLHDAYPAAAVLILFTLSVPDNLHFDSTEFVDIYFLTGRTYHDSRLRPFHHRSD